MNKVRIVWNGMGGELDSVTVKDDGEQSISRAMVKLIENNIVTAGDTFSVETIE